MESDGSGKRKKAVLIVTANPRGFCAGVERAVECVEAALELFGAPIYVRHEIVHNHFVTRRLASRGAIFVESLHEVPAGSVVLFSAHGVGRQVKSEAEQKHLKIIDATCPLVTKVHLEVAAHSRAGRTVLLIGHRGHPEVLGTVGHFDGPGQILVIESERDAARVEVPPGTEVAYVTQTTLSVDETERVLQVLRNRFAKLLGPRLSDICYATQNRQRAVRFLAEQCDSVIVVGASHSSNSQRLFEVAREAGANAHLIEAPAELKRAWFDGARVVGITSGASTPEHLVAESKAMMRSWWPQASEETIGEPEDVHFRLPREIEIAADRIFTRSPRASSPNS